MNEIYLLISIHTVLCCIKYKTEGQK